MASDKAVFGTPEVTVGIWPYLISVPLKQAMAPRQALRLMMTGERIDAAERLRLGFVTEIAPGDRLDDAVTRWVDRLSKGSPQAIAPGAPPFCRADT